MADGRTRLLEVVTAPMSAWSGRARWVAVGCGVLLGVAAVLVVVPLATAFHSPDSSHYMAMAAGHTGQEMQPFVSRQLGARVAAWLAVACGGDLRAGFLAEAALSLVFAMGVTCWFAARTAAPRWMLAALMLVASWPVLVQYLVLPDLWYAALLAGLLLLLAKERYLLAALLMLPLMLSRESTSLTLACFVAAGWARWPRAERWRYAGTAAAAAAAGSVVVARLTAGSQPNVEHLPEAVYMLAKVPWNFLRNVLGVLPWSNVNQDLCRVPMWSAAAHVGPVHAVGVCGFSVAQQLIAVENVLRLFGLLPLLAIVLWWRSRRRQGRSVVLRFALLYGGLSFALAPVLGAGFGHLMQYAWPLFLVGVPLLLDELPQWQETMRRRVAGLGLLGVHLVLPLILLWPQFGQRLGLGVALWAVGAWLLWRWLFAGVGGEKSPHLAQG